MGLESYCFDPENNLCHIYLLKVTVLACYVLFKVIDQNNESLSFINF